VKWYKKTTFCIFLFLLSGFIAAKAFAAAELTVSAALSLKAPFEEIGRIYERTYPGAKPAFNFGASGVLQKQIEAGAPSDVFASASPKEMDVLESGSYIISGTRTNFAGNSIVLLTASKAVVEVASFKDLAKRDIKRIAIGNPASVPAGKYAEEALRSMGLWEALSAKMVYAEHVRQVMDYVARGEVEAGMVFLTDALAGGKELKVISVALKPQANRLYNGCVQGQAEAAARNFIALVLSKRAKRLCGSMALLRIRKSEA
jgi:molybdate transport system substrate-binding protein